jgi:hypothetical protein
MHDAEMFTSIEYKKLGTAIHFIFDPSIKLRME